MLDDRRMLRDVLYGLWVGWWILWVAYDFILGVALVGRHFS